MNIPFFIIKEEHIRVRNSTSLYKSGKNEKKKQYRLFLCEPLSSHKNTDLSLNTSMNITYSNMHLNFALRCWINPGGK